jgi:hypothetical protein
LARCERMEVYAEEEWRSRGGGGGGTFNTIEGDNVVWRDYHS